ncbi:MAG: hypothetical protein CM1200mP1_00410 [Candidatus Neomarinimicrobiota bacterium]|nr:MAG: hypothetical protein CM1200mP1_00410 [Candidatus Neomarinimicrobiota bacterium]
MIKELEEILILYMRNTLTNFFSYVMKKNILLIVALIVIGILGRIIPHPPNFTPIIAIALLASHVFKNKWIVILTPLMAMWISDLVINNYLYAGYYDSLLIFSSSFLWVYGPIICIALLGTVLIKKVKISNIALSSISGSLIFFLVTNFGVWISGTMFPKSLFGLIECYTFALPFFGNALVGDLVYCTILFTSYSLAFSGGIVLHKGKNLS